MTHPLREVAMPVQPDPHAVELLRARLQGSFPTLTSDEVTTAIEIAIGGLARARIRNFDVVIVEHTATQELEQQIRRQARGT
ncbi:three-helix bundle dimerization domain-containing protein [Curtobacterium luteum]|uniref:three-helix bundle dimerization domain-containing protein n=1 Tax=Curtobacterium luteum TaxID=33881 RepID=UPI003808B4D0